MQASLFDAGDPAFDAQLRDLERIDLGDSAWVDYLPHWLVGHERVYRQLADGADWKQGRRLMYYRTVNVPRLTAAAPVSGESVELLTALSATLARHYAVRFAAPALAWYRDGRDGVAPHGDRIGRRCEDTIVAIVSVGAPRRFLLHPVAGGPSMAFSPGWGDLLVMGGSCQRTWLHSVPKRSRADPRISIQFRATGLTGLDHERQRPNGIKPLGASATISATQ